MLCGVKWSTFLRGFESSLKCLLTSTNFHHIFWHLCLLSNKQIFINSFELKVLSWVEGEMRGKQKCFEAKKFARFDALDVIANCREWKANIKCNYFSFEVLMFEVWEAFEDVFRGMMGMGKFLERGGEIFKRFLIAWGWGKLCTDVDEKIQTSTSKRAFANIFLSVWIVLSCPIFSNALGKEKDLIRRQDY